MEVSDFDFENLYSTFESSITTKIDKKKYNQFSDFNNNNKFSIALEGLQTSQDTSGVQANLKYTNKF